MCPRGRKYPPIQPAPAASLSTAGHSSSNSTINSIPPKRPRVGVAVACNGCRRRKIRCDGGRPVCSACEGRTDPCTYETKKSNSSSDTNGGESLLEAVKLLTAMTPRKAIGVLAALGGLDDEQAILTLLRNEATTSTASHLSAPKASASTQQQSELVLELLNNFPIAYPALTPIDMSADDGRYQRLVELSSTAPDRSYEHTDGSASLPSPSQSPACKQLNGLQIDRWTNVSVTNVFAVRAISLYLEIDHPLICPFHSELFISTLVTMEGGYCTPLLVNSLLYWACMYSKVDVEARELVDQFGAEAEKLWETERAAPSCLTMTAGLFLSFGYLVRGKNHVATKYLAEAEKIGAELGLFGEGPRKPDDRMASEELTCAVYATWGAFNWITLTGLFYRQPGMEYNMRLPVFPVPDEEGGAIKDFFSHGAFPTLCQFWQIVHEVAIKYYRGGPTAIADRVPPYFAEFKYRELLAWTDRLPLSLTQSEGMPDHVVIFHIWLHAAILDIFRPFLTSAAKKMHLKTFSASNSNPDETYSASVEQLQRLILTYRLNYASSAYTIIWHTALHYVANAMLRDKNAKDRLFYFLLCVRSYAVLRPSYRVTEAIGKGLLSMALRNGEITSDAARRILQGLLASGQEPGPTEMHAAFMLDLDLAMLDPAEATAESLARSFEENAMMTDYTNVFEE